MEISLSKLGDIIVVTVDNIFIAILSLYALPLIFAIPAVVGFTVFAWTITLYSWKKFGSDTYSNM